MNVQPSGWQYRQLSESPFILASRVLLSHFSRCPLFITSTNYSLINTSRCFFNFRAFAGKLSHSIWKIFIASFIILNQNVGYFVFVIMKNVLILLNQFKLAQIMQRSQSYSKIYQVAPNYRFSPNYCLIDLVE